VAQDRQIYTETVQVQSSVHHLTDKLGGRPRGIFVAPATDHIVSRRIVAHAVTDERTNQAACARALGITPASVCYHMKMLGLRATVKYNLES
jgi:transcriptional regulator with GAF, ATPase, and Fis domain